MHAPNKKDSKYVEQELIEPQEKKDKLIIIVEDFNPVYQYLADLASRKSLRT